MIREAAGNMINH